MEDAFSTSDTATEATIQTADSTGIRYVGFITAQMIDFLIKRRLHRTL